MDRLQAKEHVDREISVYFTEFKEIASNTGGLDAEGYAGILVEFFSLTHAAFVEGNGHRKARFAEFSFWLLDKYPDISPTDVFYSVDNVHSYT